VEAKKQAKAPNLRWGELDQDDKEAILKAVQENPAWARILLYGETRPGSREENEALLRRNDGLFDALFVLTSDATIRMTRYNNTVTRLFVPSGLLRRAWESEEEYLGLRGLDDGVDFIFATYSKIMAQTEGHLRYPFQRFGQPDPSWQTEENLNTMYLGGWMLFKKTFLLDIPLARFFAKLPRYWFADIALRDLDARESALALSVARKGRGRLTNGEINALKVFEQNNSALIERKEEGYGAGVSAWRRVF
jgi:hypothetical protein